MEKCYYCEKKVVKVAICNDWDNIPLCDKDECFNKFNKENKSQFIEQDIEEFKGKLS